MTFVSYAQNFEDVLLWRALGNLEGGRYLDVGAQDPVIDSVSLGFYEAGWRGIHVEASPDYAEKLRISRPDEIVIQAAVTHASGPIEFYEFANTGLSTGRADIAQRHAGAGREPRKIVVPSITLQSLLEMERADLNWMKIDVEGMEADVLRSWGHCPRRPWVVVVEATAPNTQERTEDLWIEEVLKRGYELTFFDGLSCYFVHKSHRELVEHLNAPANIFDDFIVAIHHFTAAKMRNELHGLEQKLHEEKDKTGHLTEHVSEAWQAYDRARHEQVNALERLSKSELEHQTSLKAVWQEHLDAERAFHGAIEQLRLSHQDWERTASSQREELARLDERSTHLDAQLREAKQAHTALEERFKCSESDRAALTAKLSQSDQIRCEAEAHLSEALGRVAAADREVVEARFLAESVGRERDEARHRAESTAKEADRLRAELQAALAQIEQASSLRSELDGVLTKLARADALIASAASEPRGQWQRIGEALGLARRSQTKRLLARWQAQPTEYTQVVQHFEESLEGAQDSVMAEYSTESRKAYLRANSLPELLSWHDVDFVRCAYVTILGRQPDHQGEAYYLKRIRKGSPKMEILWHLRRSSEGTKHDPGIEGLDRALWRATLQRAVLVGWAFRRLWSCPDSVAPGEQKFRALMNAVHMNQASLRGLLVRFSSWESSNQTPTSETNSLSSVIATAAPEPSGSQAVAPELAHLRLKSPLAQHFANKF